MNYNNTMFDDDEIDDEEDALFSIIPEIEDGIAEEDEYSLEDEEDEFLDISF